VPQNATSLNGYLYQIAKNKWLTYLSSSHATKLVPLSDSMDVEDNEDASEKEAYIAEVKKHFKTIGENCKDLLSRFYYLNESLREIAAAFGWTEATARNNKYRCIQKLKSLVKTK
jgi:RNA polymerase sigma factor (sigma-70 family)